MVVAGNQEDVAFGVGIDLVDLMLGRLCLSKSDVEKKHLSVDGLAFLLI